jgi:hypothetical protein
MQLTPEAARELEEIKQKADYAQRQDNHYMQQGFRHEASSWRGKWARLYDKQTELEKLGISTNEKKAILLTLPSMFSINSDRNLGTRGGTKVGFVAKLNAYVKVSYTKYTDFMHNVRGMGSLAGKTDIDSVEPISKETYEQITKGVQEAGGAKREVHFAGMTQVTRGGVVQEPKKPEQVNLNNF